MIFDINIKALKKLSLDERYDIWRLLLATYPNKIESINRFFGTLLFYEAAKECHAICDCPPDKNKK